MTAERTQNRHMTEIHDKDMKRKKKDGEIREKWKSGNEGCTQIPVRPQTTSDIVGSLVCCQLPLSLPADYHQQTKHELIVEQMHTTRVE